MQRFFTEPENIHNGEIVIVGDDVNHMKNSLRMKVGEQLEVCDSAGKVYLCRIDEYLQEGEMTEKNTSSHGERQKTKSDASNKGENQLQVVLKIEKEWQNETELSSQIYLFQGLPKSDKMELIIQKAVELGVYQVIPVSTNRAVMKLDEKKSTKKAGRWNSISESAAKQAGRGIIPKVSKVMTYEEALEVAKGLELILFPYELATDMSKTKEILRSVKSDQKIGVFIGPEGGFDRVEVKKAIEAGATPITLGKRILRTETAAITMLSLLMFELSC